MGDPPAYLPADARRLWRSFVDELPWLRRSDRALLESLSLLRARVMLGEDASFAHMRELRCELGFRLLDQLSNELRPRRLWFQLRAFGVQPCEKVGLDANTYQDSLAGSRAAHSLCVII
ncbi:MAG: hypothetical protein QM682_10025 [Paracoccus sp. (in: a-proteobacteria)]|uniref:hypothetical protein n=1 Tax=Paracoccus sp. TaxID=267 RepID=UPI0039E41A05